MARHVQTLDPGELIDLAALGLISEQPHAADDVVAFVKAAGGGTFSPTSEVILAPRATAAMRLPGRDAPHQRT